MVAGALDLVEEHDARSNEATVPKRPACVAKRRRVQEASIGSGLDASADGDKAQRFLYPRALMARITRLFSVSRRALGATNEARTMCLHSN